MSDMENILELQQVSKTFPRSDFALDNVSFALPYGAVLGFVGENGAGKTTTIGCILNTVNRDSGTVKLFGREMSDGDTDMREKIGVVYDGNNFPVYWTPRQLSKIMGGLYKNWDAVLFEKYLDTFDLPAKQKIRHYSRGMTMKLAIAAALSHHPQLLILDEATSGLDPVVRDDMLEVFLDFVQEEDHSILLSSHITSDLEKIADYISFIHHGKIIMTVSKNDLSYHFAVMRCRESQFCALDPEDIVAWRKRDLQIDVLVSDGRAAQRKYRDVVVDHVSIEEVMLLLCTRAHGGKSVNDTKGERV
jgi:ABC-2 type transport system ATP-binding protein